MTATRRDSFAAHQDWHAVRGGEGERRQPDHRDKVDQLLGQIQDALQAVRSLLRDIDLAPGPSAMTRGQGGGDHPGSQSFSSRRASSEIFMAGPGADTMNWEMVTRAFLREQFASVGHVGAGVLMRLMCSPGEFVPVEDLAYAAGVRSSSNRVIKVYICRLRNALAQQGLPAEAIETGRRSYRLQEDGAAELMKALTRGDEAEPSGVFGG